MNKTLLTILILGLIAGAGLGYYFGYDHGWERSVEQVDNSNNQNTTPPPPPPPSSEAPFQKSSQYGYHGTLTLTGYPRVEKRICNPGDMCGETVDYTTFIFERTSNSAVYDLLNEFSGNSFVSAQGGVGIGCHQPTQKRIFYENFSDSGAVQGSITGDDYTKLMSATKEKPVQLKMTRPIYTSGQGAPDCYSHFRNFDIL